MCIVFITVQISYGPYTVMYIALSVIECHETNNKIIIYFFKPDVLSISKANIFLIEYLPLIQQISFISCPVDSIEIS